MKRLDWNWLPILALGIGFGLFVGLRNDDWWGFAFIFGVCAAGAAFVFWFRNRESFQNRPDYYRNRKRR